MIASGDDIDGKFLSVRNRPKCGLIGSAGGHDHRLSSKISIGGYLGSFRHHELGAGDKENWRKRHFLLTLQVARSGAAFQIYVTCLYFVEAIGRRYRSERNFDVHAVEFGRRLLDYLTAQV